MLAPVADSDNNNNALEVTRNLVSSTGIGPAGRIGVVRGLGMALIIGSSQCGLGL